MASQLKIPQLRISGNMPEIMRLFKKFKDNGIQITLWQNQKGSRVISKAVIQQLNIEEKTLGIRPFAQRKFTFEKDFHFYLYGKDQSVLFKTKASFNSNKLLVLSIPKKIRLIEKRRDPRLETMRKLHNELIFDKFQGFKEKPHEYIFVVNDISQGGLSFRIFSHDLTQFAVGNKIYVKNVCGVDLHEVQEGKILYIRSYRRKVNFGTNNVFRVGVQFNYPLPQSVLDAISDVT